MILSPCCVKITEMSLKLQLFIKKKLVIVPLHHNYENGIIYVFLTRILTIFSHKHIKFFIFFTNYFLNQAIIFDNKKLQPHYQHKHIIWAQKNHHHILLIFSLINHNLTTTYSYLFHNNSGKHTCNNFDKLKLKNNK